MKKIFSLTKAFYKNNKNDSGKMKKQTKFILYLMLGIYVLVIFANFWGLFITPLKEIGRPELSLSLMITLVSIFMFVTSITYVANVLYFSNDIENILPFPFKPKEIFTAKLFTIYIYDLLISAMFLLPGFISYGLQMNANVVFYIYTLIISLLLPIIPILIVTVFFTILMQFFKFVKYKNFFRIVTTILLLAIILIFEINLNSNMDANGTYNSEYILSMTEEFSSKVPYYLTVAIDSLENINNFSGIISILWFSIINIVAVSIVIMTCDKLYLKGIYYNLNGSRNKKLNKKINYKSGSIYVSIVNKDIKNLFRNSTFFIQCVLPIFLMPIIILVMSISSEELSLTDSIVIPDAAKIITGITIIQFFMIMNYISATAISREGRKEATFLKTLPIKFEKIIEAKAMSGVIFGIFGIIISIIFLYKIFDLSFLEMIALFVIGILMNVVQSYINLIIDFVHPKLNCESDLAVVKQNINIFYAILIQIAMIAITFVLGGIFIDYNIWLFVGFFISLYLGMYVVLKIIVRKSAERLFLKII